MFCTTKCNSIYLSKLMNQKPGADSINPRVAVRAMIIKNINDFSDRKTVLQIKVAQNIQGIWLNFGHF